MLQLLTNDTNSIFLHIFSFPFSMCVCVWGGSQRGRERQTKREKDCMFTGHRTSLPSTFSRQGLTLSESHRLGWIEYSVSLSCAETTMGQPMPPFFWGFFLAQTWVLILESQTLSTNLSPQSITPPFKETLYLGWFRSLIYGLSLNW